MKAKLIFLLGILSFTVKAQTKSQPVDMSKMKTYYFVMLKKGDKRDQDSITAATIQAGHMANMQKLADAKKLAMAGPFVDKGEWRGLFIFDVSSEEEVRKLILEDPAIISGRLSYEIHPWMSEKGTCLP